MNHTMKQLLAALALFCMLVASSQAVAHRTQQALRQLLRSVHGNLLRAMGQRRVGKAGDELGAVGRQVKALHRL